MTAFYFLLALLSFLAMIVYLQLGVYAIRKKKINRLHVFFFVYCVNFALWALYSTYLFSTFQTESGVWLMYRIFSICWHVFPSLALLQFLALAGYRKLLNKWWFYLVLFVPSLFFWYGGNFVVLQGFEKDPWGYRAVFQAGSFFNIGYIIYYFVYILAGMIAAVVWGLRSRLKREKMQALFTIAPSFFTLIAATVTDSIFVNLGYKFPSIGIIMIMLWAFGTWIAIGKYGFLEIAPEAALDKILAGIQDMVILSDPQGTVHYVNDSCRLKFGMRSGERLRESLLENLGGDGNPSAAALALAGMFETNLPDTSGRSVPLQIQHSTLRDQFGDTTMHLLILRDMTESVELREQIHFRDNVNKAVPLVLSIYDRNLRQIIWSNRRIGSLLGYNEEEWNDLSYFSVVHPDDLNALDGVGAYLQDVMDGEIHNLEYRVREKNGAWVWLSMTSIAYQREPGGKLVLIMSATQDIQQRKEIELAVQESRRRFEETAKLLPNLLLELSPKGEISYLNLAASEAFGIIDPVGPDRPDVFRLVYPEDRGRFREQIQNLGNDRPIRLAEFRMLFYDGSVHSVLVSAAQLMRDRGVERVLLSAVDIQAVFSAAMEPGEEFYRHFHLTNQEIQVFNQIIQGRKNEEIASVLHVSGNTVKTHLSNLYKKLEVKNRDDVFKTLVEYYGEKQGHQYIAFSLLREMVRRDSAVCGPKND